MGTREQQDVNPHRRALTAAMAGIGMAFAGKPDTEANIEDTLLFASMAAMDEDDLRVLSVLVRWFGVHHAFVNADRLFKLVYGRGPERVRALWSALATWQTSDRRFGRLQALSRKQRIDVLATGTQFQIKRHGEDVRFADTCLRVPGNLLRDRESDVLGPEVVARRHLAYRYRVMMGPNYRADLWAALEKDPALTAAELARQTYSSFASAWQARRDFTILHGPGEPLEDRENVEG